MKTMSRRKFVTEQVSSEEDIDLLINHEYTEEELARAIKEINKTHS